MVKNFIKTYKNHQVVINALTFEKQITVIKGENGSGKSTLLKAMASLIRYDGEISLPSSVSYMHEQTTFPEDITVSVFFEGLLSLQKNQDQKKLQDLCKLFQLDHKMDVLIKTLSKGMKTKVNLIQCLLEDKDVYLLDEPFSGLDVQSVKDLVSYMKDHDEKMFIVTSHIFFDVSSLDCGVVYL